jgi:hypothetical protein
MTNQSTAPLSAFILLSKKNMGVQDTFTFRKQSIRSGGNNNGIKSGFTLGVPVD